MGRNLKIVFNFLGSLLIILGIILLVPLILVVIYREYQVNTLTIQAFLIAAVISLFFGIILQYTFKRENPNRIQGILICSLGWIVVSAVGAIPFVIGIKASYLDAYFETMSGFTTTGITMFSGLELLPKSILFWRSLIQWVGGLGILTFFLAIVSTGGGIHTLFGAESHKIEVRRPVPGLVNTIKILWLIYTLFTIFIILSLKVAGCTLFDSICHTFTALSTGGFSPYDASIAHYQIIGHPHYIWIEYILILGMFLGGTNFLIHYRILRKELRAVYDNSEMRLWFGLILFFLLIIMIERYINTGEPLKSGIDFWIVLERNFRNVLFQVISIITTTGFGTEDIAGGFFGHAARQLFLIMMVIGGCVGSTGGGIKVMRVSILLKQVGREIRKIFIPSSALNKIKIDGELLPQSEINRVAGLFVIWIVLLVSGGLITALFSHHDGYSSLSGMFSALGNIGPCYISVTDMGQLHAVIKIVYIFGMLAGRLEILPVLLLFSPRFWKI